MDFKTTEAKEIFESLQKHAASFSARKKGQQWKAILLTLASCFPEDRATIFNSIGKPTDDRDSGGARIIRKRDQVKGTKKQPAGGCEGCPKSAKQNTTGAKVSKKSTTPAEAFKSVNDVLDRFQNNANAMKAYAQSQQIKMPANVSKPETIAKYIVEHHQNDESE